MNKILIFFVVWVFVIWGYFHWSSSRLTRKSKVTWLQSLFYAIGLSVILLLVLFILSGLDIIWYNPFSKVFRKMLKWFL